MSIPPGTPSEGELSLPRERELSQKKRIALFPLTGWVFKLSPGAGAPRSSRGYLFLIFFKPYKFLKWGLVRAEECAKMDYWS